jgi:hypothetical protein
MGVLVDGVLLDGGGKAVFLVGAGRWQGVVQAADAPCKEVALRGLVTISGPPATRSS